MIRPFFLAAVPLLFTGCGDSTVDACQSYISAVQTCLAEAYVDDEVTMDAVLASYDEEAICSVYEDADSTEATDLMLCYTDAVEAGDCSTPEGWTAISTDLTACY